MKSNYETFYSNSKAEIIINQSDIDDMFKSIYITGMSSIQKSLGKDAGYIIDSVIDHNISISKYNPSTGSSYIKVPKKLDHPRKGLIKIQNIDDDNKCFKCLARYLNTADRNPARIKKANKDLDFKDMKLPV